MTGLDPETAWAVVLALRDRRGDPRLAGAELSVFVNDYRQVRVADGARPDATLIVDTAGAWRAPGEVPAEAAQLFDLFLSLCRGRADRLTIVGHLGQTIDGRIATQNGHSHYINGSHNLLHLHRLRAVADAVLIGAGTVQHDDPHLTVRYCPGRSPLRFVIDTNCTLEPHFNLFADHDATTIVFCAEDRLVPGAVSQLGRAEFVGIPRRGDWLDPEALLAAIAARGVAVLLVEGGGMTISRFLQAGLLDRLQIAIAPIILGSGRPGITLPQVDSINSALRPRARRFLMGEDVLIECQFDG